VHGPDDALALINAPVGVVAFLRAVLCRVQEVLERVVREGAGGATRARQMLEGQGRGGPGCG